MRRSSLTDRLLGFTFVRRAVIETPTSTVRTDLCLLLSREITSGECLTVHFRDVQNLAFQGIGGGVTQLPFLLVQDAEERGWDRVRYQVREEEHGRLELVSADIVLTDGAHCECCSDG